MIPPQAEIGSVLPILGGPLTSRPNPTPAPMHQHRSGADRLDEELRREIRKNRISSLFKPANQFDGSTMPFQAWWRSFRHQLRLNDIPDEEWLGIVMQAMAGAAKAFADQQSLSHGSVGLNEFIEAMENSSFGFTIPPWTCRAILQDLNQGDSSVDEFSEAIQLLAPYVDDTSDNTMRHCLATNCHPYYAPGFDETENVFENVFWKTFLNGVFYFWRF